MHLINDSHKHEKRLFNVPPATPVKETMYIRLSFNIIIVISSMPPVRICLMQY